MRQEQCVPVVWLSWKPFVASVGLFVLDFLGLAYSLFPYLVVDRITMWEAASAPASLCFVLVGEIITLPAILFYNRVFVSGLLRIWPAMEYRFALPDLRSDPAAAAQPSPV